MKRVARILLTLGSAGLCPGAVLAQDFSLHAYLDGRLVSAPDETSWTNGGVGKSRFGDGGTDAKFGGGAVVGIAQLTPAILAVADVQLQDTDRRSIDVIDAYLRYRPVSLTRWRGSLQVGAFLPPISLENDAVGWTSPWTLTPSAINSWVGEELRTFGAEGRLEWRGDTGTWELRTALFQRNDPAGKLLSIRGWSLSDLTYGLGSRLREPDAQVVQSGAQPPGRYDPFQQVGNRTGWYADVDWRAASGTKVNLMRYDNRADPAAHTESGVYAWHTSFWSLGATGDTGPITWIAQAMDGNTVIEPGEGTYFGTHYRSAFVLAGWNRGQWRPTLRIEHFSTRDPRSAGLAQGEHGNAVTAALNWRPRDWLRFTAELLRIDGVRTERADLGLVPAFALTQLQFGVRLIY
jgi:hypothetical protein